MTNLQTIKAITSSGQSKSVKTKKKYMKKLKFLK